METSESITYVFFFLRKFQLGITYLFVFAVELNLITTKGRQYQFYLSFAKKIGELLKNSINKYQNLDFILFSF